MDLCAERMKKIYADILRNMITDDNQETGEGASQSYKVDYIKTADGHKIPFVSPLEDKNTHYDHDVSIQNPKAFMSMSNLESNDSLMSGGLNIDNGAQI